MWVIYLLGVGCRDVREVQLLLLELHALLHVLLLQALLLHVMELMALSSAYCAPQFFLVVLHLLLTERFVARLLLLRGFFCRELLVAGLLRHG